MPAAARARRVPLLSAALLLFAAPARSQPPPGGGGGPAGGGGAGGGGSGMSTSGATSCSTSATTCASDGSHVTRSLSYSASTGIFTGFVVTNQCTDSPSGFMYNGVTVGPGVTPSCSNQTFPAPAYVTTPSASPLRGRTGLSLGGSNIYGPFDAGFTAGQACNVNAGTCAAGTDVFMCERLLEYTCGTANMKTGMMMDDCGGHASPYHYHCHGMCWATAASGHSPLVGIMLDGRGLYGMNETTGVMPADLDACGGHYGPVPARTIGGVTYPAAANVYHYHVQHVAPFFGGCYGPVTSMTQARSLYPTCTTNAVNISVCTAAGLYSNYTLDCPIFRMGNQRANQVTVTASCPVCTGNCAGTYNSGSNGGNNSSSGGSGSSSSTSNTPAIIGGVVGGVGGAVLLAVIVALVMRAYGKAPSVPAPAGKMTAPEPVGVQGTSALFAHASHSGKANSAHV